jgi:MoxR-like ATPase
MLTFLTFMAKEMKNLPFSLVRYDDEPLSDPAFILKSRLGGTSNNSFTDAASKFVPGEQLEEAINTAIAVGEPLLITGEPGTGKTQAAYYAAYKLNIQPVIHFQVKSDSSASDLLYYFDMVRYFHDAQFNNKGEGLNKLDYVEPRALWEALHSETPPIRVLLIDEIDKAPRDFPNDLLHELDKMGFTIPETGTTIPPPPPNRRPIVFITSNNERRLPGPFLRRCVYHHIRFSQEIVEKAVEKRKSEFSNLSEGFIKMAIQRFLALRSLNLDKNPSTGEFLVWLRVLSLATNLTEEQLRQDLSKLPYLSLLVKNYQDMEKLDGAS